MSGPDKGQVETLFSVRPVLSAQEGRTMRDLRGPQEQRFDYPTHQIARQEMVEAARAAATTPAVPARTLSCRLPLWRGSSSLPTEAAVRPGSGIQICGSPAALSPGTIWAWQGINRSFNPRRLGRPRRLASMSGARAAARHAEVFVKAFRRSDHRAGPRSPPRQDEDGPAQSLDRKAEEITRLPEGSSRPPDMRCNSLFLYWAIT